MTDQDDSPHRLIEHMRGEAYLGFAAYDPYVEDHVVPDLEQQLAANADLQHVLEIHPDTEHGFCFPQRPQYKAPAAESVWQQMIEMYTRALAR